MRVVGKILFAALVSCSCASPVFADQFSELVKRYKNREVSYSVVDLSTGKVVVAHADSKALKPASVMKVVTSGAALKVLGPEFKFNTRFFGRIDSRGHLPELYILGGADPNITIERLWRTVRDLKARGVKSIGEINLDSSHFTNSDKREGQRAYQAVSSGLALNFNSLSFTVCPGKPGTEAHIGVDPWEFGVTLKGAISTVSRGGSQFYIDELGRQPAYKARGRIRASSDCGLVHRSVSDPALYFGVVLKELFESAGVRVVGEVRESRGGTQLPLLFTHRSKPLSLILRDLNHYSTNFIAEQIVLRLGEQQNRYSRERGLFKLAQYLEEEGITQAEYSVNDGSGLSHDNRLSTRAVTKILTTLYHDPDYGAEFVGSLAVGSRSGTLKKRNLVPRGAVLRAKTGTLNGVSTLAGFLRTVKGGNFAFAIFQNSRGGLGGAKTLEKKFVSLLAER